MRGLDRILDEAKLFLAVRDELEGWARSGPSRYRPLREQLAVEVRRVAFGVQLPKTNTFEASKLNSSRHPGRGACCATRWSRSERSSICGMSGKDRQAWRVRRAVP